MMINISNRRRASLAGIFIIVAYSMLAYSITENITLGVITDIISGFAVIGIAILMYPIFNAGNKKGLNYAYIISRVIEGVLMIIGGIIILNPAIESYREIIYSDIHIYFFISGALFFYILLYQQRIIPGFISIWGIVATIMLFIVTIGRLFEVDMSVMDYLLIPMILNELFLAAWLMIKGFNSNFSD